MLALCCLLRIFFVLSRRTSNEDTTFMESVISESQWPTYFRGEILVANLQRVTPGINKDNSYLVVSCKYSKVEMVMISL